LGLEIAGASRQYAMEYGEQEGTGRLPDAPLGAHRNSPENMAASAIGERMNARPGFGRAAFHAVGDRQA
jgi:hypothetical protein